jgi:hypothetical protein
VRAVSRRAVRESEVRASRALLLYQRVEDALRRVAASVLLSVGSGARPQQLVLGPQASYVGTLPDRSQQADYGRVDRAAAYRHRVDVYLGGETPSFRAVPDLEARWTAFDALIRKIQARGGRVVLVRFPTTKRIWQMDQILYPKDVYWDTLVARTSGQTVHFAEHESLSSFDLPDGVHLDYRDAPRSRALLRR